MTLRQFLYMSAAIGVGLALLAALVLSTPVMARECTGRIVSASWYGTESGNRTATGERFDGRSLTAAMPSRKHFGERYRVTFKGKSVTVRINDLGPASRTGRGIDLSRAAAARIGLIGPGHGRVCLERL